MEIIEKIRKVIEGYYLETTEELYIPESVVGETINLISDKSQNIELFCVYNKKIVGDLLYSTLADIVGNTCVNYSIKQSFAIKNVKQIDDFLSKRLVDIYDGKLESRVVLLSNVSIENMPEIFDFILFDNRLVLALDSDNDGGYYLSTDKDMIKECRKWLDVGFISAKELEYFFLQEPLMRSANMVNEIATVLCSNDHVDVGDCYWYHSIWQYLRLMNMVSTPSWHHDFYLKQIRETYKMHKRVKVLISGAADYSSLSYVVRGLEDTIASTEYTVLDLCDTPLFSCKWYAKFRGITISTMKQSIFALNESKKYDLICTDAFLTRFCKKDICKILSIWNEALCDGGHVITTVRIHDDEHPCPDTPSNDDVKSFRERAVERLKIWGGFINCTVEEIEKAAETYATKMHSNHIGNRDEIVRSFESTGYKIVCLEDAEVEGELYPSRYLRINAIKVCD